MGVTGGGGVGSEGLVVAVCPFGTMRKFRRPDGGDGCTTV